MKMRLTSRVGLVGVVIGLAGLVPRGGAAEGLEPIVYTIRFPAADKHLAEVEATVPTQGRPEIALMMAVWSPGFYRLEDYAQKVQDLSARTADGAALEVKHPRKNRWTIRNHVGAPKVVVSYRLTCDRRSVTTNWVAEDLIVLNGAATCVTLVEQARRPHEIRLELPARCKRSATAMDPASDGQPNHYRAEDYDTLVDSPIVAGDLSFHEFEVDGSKHILADAGEIGRWDGALAAHHLEKMVGEARRFWGFLPFRRYVFLNVFRAGGGGLEHKNSTLLTASPRGGREPGSVRWLSFVSHEYFHAFNVKRLRPIELGPFDYEHPPSTKSLWIAEGLTTYFGDLIIVRAGLATRDDLLAMLSSHIGQLQNAKGRLVQTLEEASLDVWSSGTSGVGRDPATKLSYYVKGPVVGFLLDARIRRATGGKQSLDDVMRLAYNRYSGECGFTPEQFRGVAEEVAGVDLKEWYHRAIASTEELDYREALDWFGLRFAPTEASIEKPSNEPAKAAKKASVERTGPWKLEVRPDATAAQKDHLHAWSSPAGGQ
jgi:predicted metalloprotease with PDZ domain